MLAKWAENLVLILSISSSKSASQAALIWEGAVRKYQKVIGGWRPMQNFTSSISVCSSLFCSSLLRMSLSTSLTICKRSLKILYKTQEWFSPPVPPYTRPQSQDQQYPMLPPPSPVLPASPFPKQYSNWAKNVANDSMSFVTQVCNICWDLKTRNQLFGAEWVKIPYSKVAD